MVYCLAISRRDGVLTGYEQEIWCTNWTCVVEVLQKYGIVCICAVEMEYSLNMGCKDCTCTVEIRYRLDMGSRDVVLPENRL